MAPPRRLTDEQRRAYKRKKSLEYYYRHLERNREAAKLRGRARNGYGKRAASPRAVAKAAGETRYWTGKPCANGHVAERMVSNGRCIDCMYEWRERYREANPDKYRAEIRRKNETVNADPRQKLMHRIRLRVHRAVKKEYRTGSAVKLLGCSVEAFKAYIESLWLPGMSWDNWSAAGWHLDHIKPLYQFDLTDPEQLAQACHHTNYQPLWAADNLRKNKF